MTDDLHAAGPIELETEWTRMALLAQALIDIRRGIEPSSDAIGQLQMLQAETRRLRWSKSAWRKLPVEDLPPTAFEVLACVFAAEANPRVGSLYQSLQVNQLPYPSISLMQQMLALDAQELHSVRGLLTAEGPLVRRGLVETKGEGAFVAVEPMIGMVGRLMGWSQVHPTLPGAVRVHQTAGWNELILPPDRLEMLKEFLIWIRHRETVVREWGGRATGGPVALLAGPSGTGKTHAASVLASQLEWPLYRVDLANLVSKYVGETEKNIGRLLDAAHGKQLVLLFDEVDALMSRRAEVKDPRDRYANMEVSYLLARIEEHDGPCILTTNFRAQIDKAFFRRFQLVVEFPRPDAPARARLWDLMLPPRAPRAASLDLAFLAQAVPLNGGSIRNAALHAAYLAAEDRSAIDLRHVALGVWRELSKERTRVTRSDLGAFGQHLPKDIETNEAAA